MPTVPLTGRDETLSEIVAAWERLAAGGAGPVAVALTGEAGIGKTRVLRAAVAAIDPPVLLYGTARADGAAPHDWFAAATAGADRPEGIDERVWRVLRQEPAAPSLSLPDGALLRAAVRTVRRLAGDGPALVAVDDLHWLDLESLTLWSELAAAWDLPVMLVACSRAPEEARHPEAVARVLSRLDAVADGVRLPLPPLTLADTSAMLGALAGRSVPHATARSVHRRTGGVPFWIGELAASGLRDGAPLPGRLAALVRSRLAGAGREAWRLARAAALLGERVDLEVLEAVVGAEAVADALPELVAAGVLQRAGGRAAFPHALMREAFAATVLPDEERSLRRAALRAAQKRGDDAAVAAQAQALGETDLAVEAAVRTARRRLAAWTLDSARLTAETGLRSAPDEPRLLAVAGRAAMLTGDFAAARRHLERRAATAEDAEERCEALLWLCETAWHEGRIGDQWRLLEAAEALAEPGGVAHARCLTGRAVCLVRSESYREALEACERAAPLVERCGRPGNVRSVAISRATALHYLGRSGEAVAQLREVWRESAAAGDLRKLARAVNNLLVIELATLTEAQAWRRFHAGVEAVGEVGMTVWGGKINRIGADAAMRFGDLERAWELLSSRVREEPDPHERAVLAAKAGLLAVERDDLDAAEELRREGFALAGDMDQGWVVTYQYWLAAAIAARRGDRSAVAAAMGAYRDSVTPELHRRRPYRVLEVARLAVSRGVEADAVRRFVTACLDAMPAPGDSPDADLLWMAMRSARGDWAGVLALLDGAAALEPPARRAEALLLAADAARRLGDTAAAAGHAEAALELLRRWPGEGRRRAEALLAALRETGPVAALTNRESEVLAAVASGRSNRQIAAGLGISQRTVEVHISRILAKTGAASRTEAAAAFLRLH